MDLRVAIAYSCKETGVDPKTLQQLLVLVEGNIGYPPSFNELLNATDWVAEHGVPV